MAWVPLVAGVVSMAGSLVSGISQAGQAQQRSSMDRANADIAEQTGESNADAIRLKARRIAGSNRAAAGASGIDASAFMDAIDDSNIEAELDAQTAEYNGRAQARNYKLQSGADSSAGNGAMIGGFTGAVGAGTQAVSEYGNWKLLDKGLG